MKQKIKFIDNIDNKIVIKEVNVPDKLHLDAQIRFKSIKFKPKKGKGSFSRQKFKKVEEF